MVEIIFEKDKARAIANDGENIVGVCEFLEDEESINITHTKVNEMYRGEGIGKRLVETVIKEARASNKKIGATCSYAKKILEKEESKQK